MTEKFSVVIPLYNKAPYVQRAINSILAQSYQNFEILVVDDCSTDNGGAIVRLIQDARIRVIQQEVNRGVSAARNRGVSEAQYHWIAFLDADDEWKPDFLETITSLQVQYPGCGSYATSYEYHFQRKGIEYPLINGIQPGWKGIISDYFKLARTRSPLWTGSIVISRELLIQIGGFPEGISHGEDIITWIRVFLKRPMAYAYESKAIYHQEGPGQLSKSRVGLDVGAIYLILALHSDQQIQQEFISTYRIFVIRYVAQTARRLIILDGNSQVARVILKSFFGMFHIISWQVFWLYFWSFLPKTFRFLVGLKENMKSKFTIVDADQK